MTGPATPDLEVYLHDSSVMFRFVLRGQLAGSFVREVEHAWITAGSILGSRDLVVDVSELSDADSAGIGLLLLMRQSGARITPSLLAEGFTPLPAWAACCCRKRSGLPLSKIRATKLQQLLDRRHWWRS